MRCPKCSHMDDKVIDSRTVRNGDVIRRRRVCLDCGHRFTTYEEVVKSSLRVIKRDGRHEELDRKKMQAGIVRACEKRSISTLQMENLMDSVINELDAEYEREVPSTIIGKKVMDKLEMLDEVAYVRFASVYRRFKDVNQFLSEVEGLIERGVIPGEFMYAIEPYESRTPLQSFVDAVASDILTCCPELALRDAPVRDVAEGIAGFCEERYGSFRLSNDYYGLLAARGLWSIGEDAAALQVMRRFCRRAVQELCDPAGHDFRRVEQLLALSSARVVRPGQMVSLGPGQGVVLDLTRLRVNEQESIELLVWAAVRKLMSTVMHVWDRTNGEGWLVVSGADGVLGRRQMARRRQMRRNRVEKELFEFCEDVLLGQARKRNWTYVPVLKKLRI